MESDAEGHIPRDWFRLRVWGPAVKAAQLGVRVTVRDLRHAHASWLLAGGADLQVVKERLGSVHGCSHLTELVGHLPTAAVQMFAGLVPEDDGRQKPFQLDRCHALESHSETVRRWYPKWYRGAA